MEQNTNTNLLLRFIKDENLYTTVINSLKYYYKIRNEEYDFYNQINHASRNGNNVYRLFEWILRLQFLKANNYNYETTQIIKKQVLKYESKWKEYIEKNNYKIK